MRGVPRARRAISAAPSASSGTPRMRAGALEDRDEVARVVVVEARDEAEAVAQRPGDETGARGGTDEREAREVEADRARRRALADHDVELEVLHRGVEHLFDRPRQAVDLVDEQHVAVVEVGEDRGEVTGAFERGAARDAQRDVELGGDDPRQRGLAEPRRAGEEEVVDRLPAPRAAPSMISRCSLRRGCPTNSSRRWAGASSPPPPRPDRRSSAQQLVPHARSRRDSPADTPATPQTRRAAGPRRSRRRRAGRARRAPRRASSRDPRAPRAPRRAR